ncbi:MAG: T9SS type A sorting domain-containing protein [Candidatus Aegiribacteria sp.]|nr:T9SS type A sorting domain-containing protein [Candidatus Aegiribacteria sp.]
MRQIRLHFLILLILLSTGVQLFAQTWVERTPIPTSRWYPCSVVIDEKIYVIGGMGETSPYSSLTIVEVYDVPGDSCETMTPMTMSRWGAMAAVVDNKIYVIGGLTGSFVGGYSATDAAEVYDPGTNTWTAIAPIPSARGWGGCAVVNDTIFVFGGYGGLSSAVLKYYPPKDTWFTEANMPNGRYTFMTAQANDKVYLIGGWGSDLVQEYDPVTKVWTTMASMPTSRGASGIAVINDTIYVAGGRGGNSRQFECFNPVINTWASLSPMPTAREGLIGAAVDGRFFAIAGSVPVSQGGFPFYNIVEEADFSGTGISEGAITPYFLTNLSVQPNPFNLHTSISFTLDNPQSVELCVFDLTGRRIAVLVDGLLETGPHCYNWEGMDLNGQTVASGTYILRITSAQSAAKKKVLLLR